jgi:formylglycine-generating enzyme required for sulfatase activity
MSFTNWLRNLPVALNPGPVQHKRGPRRSRRVSTDLSNWRPSVDGNIPRRFFGCIAILVGLATTSHAVTMQMVAIGSPGNVADPTPGSPYGAVPYSYKIGAYDVTNAQYVELLNAKAASADPYGLWSPAMNPSGFEGAISRSGSGPYSYAVKPGYANKPVIYVSWIDSIRFVNWLTNGQGNGDTESGTYAITGGGNNSGTVAVPDATQRATWAATGAFHWLLPSEDEWYKAAYFNAAGGTYYAYPFRSNSPPAASAPPGNTNSGNFFDSNTQSNPAYNYDGSGSYLTDVGAYPNSLSPFGSFDMGGDVWQWNEALIVSPYRGLRGSSWRGGYTGSAASFRTIGDPTAEVDDWGFRVASVGDVPEPPTIISALVGLAGLLIFSQRERAILRLQTQNTSEKRIRGN